jgi:hypothetical protein
MAPLSEMGDGLGARIATATDDANKLSLRSRVFYMPDESRMVVAYDVLYGYKVLNRNLLVRYQD